MELLIIFVAWIIFSYVLAELIPAAFALTGYAISFLALCVFESVKFTLKGAVWAALWSARAVTWASVRLAKEVSGRLSRLDCSFAS